jgi:hypothetical protein
MCRPDDQHVSQNFLQQIERFWFWKIGEVLVLVISPMVFERAMSIKDGTVIERQPFWTTTPEERTGRTSSQIAIHVLYSRSHKLIFQWQLKQQQELHRMENLKDVPHFSFGTCLLREPEPDDDALQLSSFPDIPNSQTVLTKRNKNKMDDREGLFAGLNRRVEADILSQPSPRWRRGKLRRQHILLLPSTSIFFTLRRYLK